MELSRVVIDKLEGQSNWMDWKFQIRIQLQSHGVISAVDGTLKYPNVLSGETTEIQRAQYSKNMDAINKMEYTAQNLIVSSLSYQVRQLINMCTKAKEMWDKLHSIYEQRTEQRQDRLFNQFFGIHEKDPHDSVAKHIAKLEKLWVELQDETWREDKVKLPESLFLNRILNTLPSEYFEFTNAWESVQKDQRTVTLLRERLCTVELRLQEKNGEDEDFQKKTALLAKKKFKIKNNPDTREKKKEEKKNTGPTCYNCGEKGHLKRDCQKKKPKEARGSAFVGISSILSQVNENDIWIADSGATQHMTSRREWFSTFEQFSVTQYVLVGNKQHMKAPGKGNIDVEMFVDGKWVRNYLKDVWFLPEVSKNLFSLTSVVDNGMSICLQNKSCSIMKSINVVATGERRNSLYVMHMRVVPPEAIVETHFAADDTLQVWHERLAHQNKRYVQHFLKERGINVTGAITDEFCESCMYGKQHRLSFGQRQVKTQRPGDLVHADVCGPMPTKSIGGAKYFVAFKDDFSKYRSVYFLKEKSEVADKLQSFLNEVKVLGHTVKELLTDNGREFSNRVVAKITQNSGLHHRMTMPYTPEQNGAAERENRTLVEAARTMLHSGNFPESLWAEAVNNAAFVLNRSGPTSVIGKTPIELWTGKIPSVNHFKIFGTECFVHVPKQKRKKWDKKSLKGYLVGYCHEHDGYRIWIPEKNDVLLSRDVIFREENTVKESLVVFQKSTNNEESHGVCNEHEHHVQDEQVSEEVTIQQSEEATGNQECESNTRYLRDRSNLTLPSRFDAFAMFAEYAEPKSFKEALNSCDASYWKTAMDEEIQSLNENSTWKLVDLPPHRKPVTNRWVYRIKENPNGSVARYKARLVARGFSQIAGTDYYDTYAPVARFDTIRTVLAVTVTEKLFFKQFDVKTAFLYGHLTEEIYMEQPEGYEDGTKRVCRLVKSLYGLKQAPRCWNRRLTDFMLKFGLIQSTADSCLFVRKVPKLIVIFYVDDGIIAGADKQSVQEFRGKLEAEFKITYGDCMNFLGIQIEKIESDNGGIFIHQAPYTQRILEKFKMSGAVAVSTPIEKGFILGEEDDENLEENVPFRSAVGSLMYLAVATRPDIAFAVNFISQALAKPRKKDWEAVKRVMKYLVGTVDYGICYNSSPTFLEVFSDADYGGDTRTRRSTSGMVSKFAKGAITWLSQKQRSVSLSTTEAEYIAGSEAAKEVLWLKRLLQEVLFYDLPTPVLRIDNASAIKLIRNPEFHKRSKHIDVRYHFIREKVEDREFDVLHVSGENQIADILTKPLPRVRFGKLRLLLGVNKRN